MSRLFLFLFVFTYGACTAPSPSMDPLQVPISQKNQPPETLVMTTSRQDDTIDTSRQQPVLSTTTGHHKPPKPLDTPVLAMDTVVPHLYEWALIKLTDFVSTLYFDEKGKLHQFFYKMPKNKGNLDIQAISWSKYWS